jgi:beta-galactosidase
MNLEKIASFVLLSLPLCAAGWAGDAAMRTRDSFNKDWRFDRFGAMPDGSKRTEPGASGWTFSVSASSEESGKGNVAQNALDGDSNTRWCANGDSPQQWLRVDFNKAQNLGGAEIDWEDPSAEYGFAVEGSTDGKKWTELATGKNGAAEKRVKLSGSYASVRVKITSLPAGKWASIAEVRLFDAAGQPIKNQKTEASRTTPEIATYDDSAWRKLDVPHDWGIEGPFRADLPNDTGKLPWKGIGWYRKHFKVATEDQGKRIFIDFDGAMANSKVWLNGQYAGGWPYGYNSFRVELTPFVKFGEENVMAVRLDTEQWGSRWYPGAGIYRNVWLVKTQPVHVAQYGVYITTPVVTDEKGDAKFVVTLDNQDAKDATASVQTDIYETDKDGKPGKKVASTAKQEKQLASNASGTLELTASVSKPKRWDITSPIRYLARTVVTAGGKEVDTYDQMFGFRTIEFTTENGFLLNGKHVPLNGTCNHHDLGSLGAAINMRAMERQLEVLKEMGCNALRTSHNPCAPEWVELADRMGFVVLEEAFDCWKAGKTGNDYSKIFDAWHKRDLEAMVRRDYNHPSIIMWSTGNEIIEQNDDKMVSMLRDIIHAVDPTRPVTAGCNNGNASVNGFQNGVDVFGLNYNTWNYDKAVKHPGNEKKPFYSSESSSTWSSRGEYFWPIKRGAPSQVNFQTSSYDVDFPGWATLPEQQFEALDKHAAFAGEFVWTGFDYIGEPTPYNNDATNLLNFSDPAQKAAMQAEMDKLGKLEVPSAISYFGIVDLCGFKKDRFYHYQARWRPDLPVAHIFPHWNWPDRVGQVTPVHVYTSGDEAELFLNGKSLGKKQRTKKFDQRLRWDDVVYEAGELKVVAYKDGKEWAKDSVKTTGEAAKVLLKADRDKITADGFDLSYITVTIADKEGLMVPRSKNLVKFEVSGPGEVVAVGNGDSTSHESFQAKERKAYNGLCLVIVRSKPGQTGAFKVKAVSEGLTSAEISVTGK